MTFRSPARPALRRDAAVTRRAGGAVYELAGVAVLVLTLGALIASPFIAWKVVAGVARLAYSYPP